MPIRPHTDESESQFMSRCMRDLKDAPTDRSHEQMVAICMRAWRDGPATSKAADDDEE